MSGPPVVHDLVTLLCGSAVGLLLGLVGGGGSIIAVPLLVYVVGIRDPHVAIGTGALAVGANAAISLFGHWRIGNVKLPCALTFASAGVAGALLGSMLGKVVDGQRLLLLFAVAMLAAGLAMLLRRDVAGDPGVRITPEIAVRLGVAGLLTGFASGFFGIGGGFLVVPGLMLGSGMPMLQAVGSSLFAVAAFAFTTAASYAWSGLVDGRVAVLFILGGAAGGYAGTRLATRLAARRGVLARLFAILVIAVALYMALKAVTALASGP